MGGLLTIAALFLYILLFNILGFIVATALYLFFQILILSNEKNRNIKLFALIAIATSSAIYFIFVYIIQRPLPTGILYFI